MTTPTATLAPSDSTAERASTKTLPGQGRSLGRGTAGWPLPRLPKRFRPLHWASDAVAGWLAPLGVTLLAGVIRFWNLTTPPALTFDETYYAKDAWALLTKGYAAQFIDAKKADPIINGGSTKGIFSGQVNQVVHPDFGKWMIAVGEWMFGLTPLGWRFIPALVGTLMVLVTCRLVRRLTGSTLLGCVAGLLLAFDGLEFVMSRFALVDILLAFWLLCAAHCLVADRDWARIKMARRLLTDPDAGRTRFGPVRGFLVRPWRIGAGVCFGFAGGVKWSALPVFLAFGLLTWAWDSGMRRAIGVRWSVVKSGIVDALPAFFSFFLVAIVVYVATWSALLINHTKYEQQFGTGGNSIGELSGSGMMWGSYINDHPTTFVGQAEQALHTLWEYHVMTYRFHTGPYLLRVNSPHPYMSHPGGWLIINRPLGIANISGDASKVPGCPVGEQCVRQVKAMGTPILWWGGVVALIVCLYYWILRRDWRFSIPVVGVASTWLPWFRWDDRTIFYYYAVATIPFTVIGVTLVLGKVLGAAHASRERRVAGAAFGGLFVLAVALNFFYLYPVLSYDLITLQAWQRRMWFPTWN